MKRRHLLSSISFRLLVFNLLILVFPIASFLFLNTYEEQLLQYLEHALVQQGRVMAAALGGNGEIKEAEAVDLLTRLEKKHDARFRILDAGGAVIADSSTLPLEAPGDIPESAAGSPDSRGGGRETPETAGSYDDEYDTEPSPENPRERFLYRLASLPVRLLRNYLLPPAPPIESGDFYRGADRLLGDEVEAALAGRYGAATRISTGGQISVTLYSALPVTTGDEVDGVVLVSQSSYRILQDLYRLRLDIFTIFLLSLLATVIISIFLSITISRPLKKLSRRAADIFTPGRGIKGKFYEGRRKDEIGKLASSLNRMADQLRDHIDFIESFAGDVSHELKNPIASIRSSAEVALGLAEEDSVDEAGMKRFLAIIEREAARMESLISSIREISKIDTRLTEEERTSVDLCELTEQVVRNFRYRLTDRSVEIRLHCPDEPVFILFSPGRIVQVVENLIDNAVSFSPPGGTVSVRIDTVPRPRGGGTAARLTVSDEGPGIPDEIIKKIFNRFFTYRTVGDDAEHAGLGLAIVKAIVEGYGGSISAVNSAERGAFFTVILPAAGSEAG